MLEGELEIESADGSATYRAGQGPFLLAGEAQLHRARVVGDRALLILVEPE